VIMTKRQLIITAKTIAGIAVGGASGALYAYLHANGALDPQGMAKAAGCGALLALAAHYAPSPLATPSSPPTAVQPSQVPPQQ
jgi:hypothetical protein